MKALSRTKTYQDIIKRHSGNDSSFSQDVLYSRFNPAEKVDYGVRGPVRHSAGSGGRIGEDAVMKVM